ncbi:MAG: DUF5060 domain-containing protein [Saccharofermentanales bacterium]
MNEVCEVILTSAKYDADDIDDVRVSAVFTGPDGQKYEMPGKHYEKTKWRIRFKPPTEGAWSYVTTCHSDPGDKGLNNIEGTVVRAHEIPPKVFNAGSDYANTLVDTRLEIQNAIDAAIKYSKESGLPSEIRLKADSTYRVEAAGDTALVIENAKNVIFNGQGATLVFTNVDAGGLKVVNSENVIVKNINIDYDPLPYSFGTVTYVNGDVYRLKFDPGYIEPDDPAYDFAKRVAGVLGIKITYNGTKTIFGQPVVGSKTFVSKGDREWELDGSTLFLGGGSNTVAGVGLKTGDRFVLKAGNYAAAVAFLFSNNVTAENIVVYTSPGLSFLPSVVDDIVIRDCHVRVNSGRPISTNADGIHMRGARGNVMIDGCTFEGMCDDGINIHSSPMSVLSKHAANKYGLSRGLNSIRIGDRLAIIEQGKAKVKDIVTVSKSENETGEFLLTFDKDIDLKAGTGFSDADNLYNLDECASAFAIKDCSFDYYRGRGILLSCQNGIVYGNKFNILGGPAISFNHETVWWGEGPFGKNIIIKNNIFANQMNSSRTPIISHIEVAPGNPESQGLENIFITENVFNGFGSSRENVASMKNVKPGTLIFAGNKLQ